MDKIPTAQELAAMMLNIPGAMENAVFAKQLHAESDRGCALFGAARLESLFGEILLEVLLAHPKAEEELLKGDSPLATFSARTRMAFYMGLITQEEKAEIDRIRDIRNKFAHRHNLLAFTDEEIRSRCANLMFSLAVKGSAPRSHYQSAVCVLAGRLMSRVFNSKHTAPLVAPSFTPEEKAMAQGNIKEAMDQLKNHLPDVLEKLSGKL